MAISAIHYRIFRDLFQRGLLPQGAALLEIGQANWYGDVGPLEMIADIEQFVTDSPRRALLIERLRGVVAAKGPEAPFEVAEVFYELFFSPTAMQAVDFQGSNRALRLDLNGPLVLGRRFNTVINHQTAEHVFHIGQIFKTAHDYTAPEGLMIHECAFTAAIDHGFYNVQPTLFFDLAEANDYQLLGLFVEDSAGRAIHAITRRADVYAMAEARQVPNDALLLAVLKRGTSDREFEYPIQGFYRKALDDEGLKAWRELR